MQASSLKKCIAGYAVAAASASYLSFARENSKINYKTLGCVLLYCISTRLIYHSYLKESLRYHKYVKLTGNLYTKFFYMVPFIKHNIEKTNISYLSFFLNSKNLSVMTFLESLNPVFIFNIHSFLDIVIKKGRELMLKHFDKKARADAEKCIENLILFDTNKTIEENLSPKTPLEEASFLVNSLFHVYDKNNTLPADQKVSLKDYFNPTKYQSVYNMLDPMSSLWDDTFLKTLNQSDLSEEEKKSIISNAQPVRERLVNIDSIVKESQGDYDFIIFITNYFTDVKRGNRSVCQGGKKLSEFVISLLQFALVIQHNKKFQSIKDKSFKTFYTQCAFLTEELVPKKFIKNNWHDHI